LLTASKKVRGDCVAAAVLEKHFELGWESLSTCPSTIMSASC